MVDPRLPDGLAERLSAMHDAKLFVPAGVDDAVLARAREHFGQEPASRMRLWLRIAGPAAAAATIALGVWAVWPSVNQGQSGAVLAVAGDADGSGAVDVLDAFAMARVVDAGQPAPAAWDVTGDGRVNREDVSAVAAMAVSLSGDDKPAGGASL
jgi:hypothetical protein